ncbi:MAG: aldolase/citrate lyase family protein [Syntrophales bacterium]|jgi:2-keto-3-deoxy-L-rhamnonate aldolase RhmA
MPRSLKQMLRTQELVVGLTVQQVTSPWLAKVYADAGADFVFIEGEHGSLDPTKLADFVLTCRLCGLPVVAKCNYLDRGSITRLLDAGVMGIQLPMTEMSNDVARLISYMKFAPVGNRAFSPGIGNTDYKGNAPNMWEEWIKEMNEETVVIAHVETKTGLENIEEIMAFPEVDVLSIGVFDLMVSLEKPGKFNDLEVLEAIGRLIDAAHRHSKVIGLWTPSYEAALPLIKKGVRFIETGGEIILLTQACQQLVSQFPRKKI